MHWLCKRGRKFKRVFICNFYAEKFRCWRGSERVANLPRERKMTDENTISEIPQFETEFKQNFPLLSRFREFSAFPLFFFLLIPKTYSASDQIDDPRLCLWHLSPLARSLATWDFEAGGHFSRGSSETGDRDLLTKATAQSILRLNWRLASFFNEKKAAWIRNFQLHARSFSFGRGAEGKKLRLLTWFPL